MQNNFLKLTAHSYSQRFAFPIKAMLISNIVIYILLKIKHVKSRIHILYNLLIN